MSAYIVSMLALVVFTITETIASDCSVLNPVSKRQIPTTSVITSRYCRRLALLKRTWKSYHSVLRDALWHAYQRRAFCFPTSPCLFFSSHTAEILRMCWALDKKNKFRRWDTPNLLWISLMSAGRPTERHHITWKKYMRTSQISALWKIWHWRYLWPITWCV